MKKKYTKYEKKGRKEKNGNTTHILILYYCIYGKKERIPPTFSLSKGYSGHNANF
jgi:hypothetical protein